MEQPNATRATEPPQPQWRPLRAIDRRVAGVLAEKAKTTPDIYPMSLNAVCTGCNQKSNRHPVMALEPDDVEESLDRLREMGAVALVEGYGRVRKFRHYLYQWLGVDKVELAVMAELLLRGEQTVGELRARAARMEPISGIEQLRPVLQSLMDKKLVMALSPEGRGQIISHGLYKDRELADLQARAASMAAETAASESRSQRPVGAAGPQTTEDLQALRTELQQLQEELAEVKSELAELKALIQ